MSGEEEVVSEILKVSRRLQKTVTSDLDGDQLSRIALKLASYKVTLGGFVAEARLSRDEAEAQYLHTREQSYKTHRAEGKAIGDSDNLKRIESEEEYQAYIKASYNFERLRNLHNDCHDMIDSVRSRLIHLLGERGDQNG